MILLAAGDAAYHWAFDLEIWSLVVFLLLATVLGVFASGPILAAMKKREEGILDSLRQADIAAEESRRLIAEHEATKARHRAEAREMIAEAKRDAARTIEEILARAREEAQRQQRHAGREIDLARQKAVHELWQLAADLSAAVAEKAIRTRVSAQEHLSLIRESIDDIGKGAVRR